MTFCAAMMNMPAEQLITRESWLAGQFVGLKLPESGQFPTVPYFYMVHPDRGIMPWTPGHDDLLADDWKVCSSPVPPPDPGVVE